MSHSPELLLPAGNPEAFFAALQAGAGAVYLGLEQFNAHPLVFLSKLPGKFQDKNLLHLGGGVPLLAVVPSLTAIPKQSAELPFCTPGVHLRQ